MNQSLSFACGLAVTAGISFGVVSYLNRPLQKLLEELCGGRERAQFWTGFSNVTLVVVPVIFAMQTEPEPGPAGAGSAALFQVANQVKWGLAGLMVSVLILGWITGRFILRDRVSALVRTQEK